MLTRQTKILASLMVMGLVLRLSLIGADGFPNDISTFEAWTLTLRDHGFGGFYANAGFADYPPGYLYILGLIAALYSQIGVHDAGFGVLHTLIKLPAIFADLGLAYLAYAIAHKLRPRYALWAAGAILFNPALICISADWGQVDAVAAIGSLAAVGLMISGWTAVTPQARRIAVVGAWCALAASILIKPAPVVLVPFFLCIPLVAKSWAERIRELIDTGLGIAAFTAVLYLLALPFAPEHDPVGVLSWLYERYRFGANVYPFNSVNAFNLYAISAPFWMPDTVSTPLTFGLKQSLWGIGLVVTSVAVFTARFFQKASKVALLEGAMLAALAFFAFATRMHERYIFTALILLAPLVVVSRAYVFAMLALTATLCANLYYSFTYIQAMAHPVAGMDPRDLIPAISHPASFLVVLTLLALSFRYLGFWGEAVPLADDSPSAAAAPQQTWWQPKPAHLLEGLAPFTKLDYALSIGLSICSFLFCVFNYWLPTEKVFDEIYYARSGAEYLKHIEQYEWTHPPLTKLVITVSMMLFGGIPHGDTSTGWRFLNVVVGAVMVYLLYRFTKRISNSTVAASIAAGLLTIDGFHFVQSRIATPEITVACLSLATLVFFYEYWVAAQVRRIPYFDLTYRPSLYVAVACIIPAGVIAQLLIMFTLRPTDPATERHIGEAVIYTYCVLAGFAVWYLVEHVRRQFSVRTVTADGSEFINGRFREAPGDSPAGLHAALGAAAGGNAKSATKPASLQAAGAQIFTSDHPAEVGAQLMCTADGRLIAQSAQPRWQRTLAPATADRALVATAIAAGLLAASKWNGLFDLILVWAIMLFVSLSPYFPSLAAALGLPAFAVRPDWGNPKGFRFRFAFALTLMTVATIYAVSYIPYFLLGHNFADLLTLQHSMYAYHHDLRATHPYQSVWWQWPILQRPISYYYHDFRIGADHASPTACCVAEILALPNPLSWWAGLVTIPLIAWLGYRERRKGYALIILAYFAQWLPWIASPRIAFEYHFFPNLSLICAANGIILARFWAWRNAPAWAPTAVRRGIVITALVLTLAATAFWYPLNSGMPISYDNWHVRVLDWVPFLKWI